MLLAESMIKI